MDGVQLVVGCVALTLLSFCTACCQTLKCNYQYQQQPSKARCNPGAPLPLELRCAVSFNVTAGIDNFTIQWHYSNSFSPPSHHNSTSMETILQNKTSTIDIEVINNTSSKVSVLRLTNYSETASGHYWCTVNTIEQPSQETLNPSQVINISICPFAGGTTTKIDGEELHECEMQVDLFETLMTDRCAEDPASIDDIQKVQLGSTEMCAIEKSTTTDDTAAFSSPDQSTTSPTAASGSSMQYAWMIVGIAFGALIVIIVVMLIAIVYLNHKRNKIRVSTETRNHIRNPYVEYSNPDSLRREALEGATTGDQHEIRADVGYEIPMNVIHAHNATFGGDHSPGSKTSLSRSTFHSPPGEYEEVSTVKAARDSIKAAQRHQYQMVESGEESEYSHLQHAHGGSRKFSTNSTGTARSPSMPQSRGKTSITSSLSLSGHQPGPIFDSPEYMTIGSKSTEAQPETGERIINGDTGYSHINPQALKGMDTTSGEAEGPDLADSESYHQLPSAFTGLAEQQPRGEIAPEQRQNSRTPHTHPPAHRHKSATLASEPYTPIETANVKKRNTYSFTIVSTDEQYVSERGHTYHLLERSDEHQRNRSPPDSNEGSPKFRIAEDDSTEESKESSSIPPYSHVDKLPEQDSNKQKEETDKSKEQSDSSSLQESSMESSRKVIPPYSQVDKSKKKNRQPQAQLDTQLNPETHHYHTLERNSEDKTEKLSGEKGGPIYHVIDHEP